MGSTAPRGAAILSGAMGGGQMAIVDEFETYMRVLDGITTAHGFVGLLDESVELEDRGTDNLWRCFGYEELVELVHKAYGAGVRIDVLNSWLVGHQMMLESRVRRPTFELVPDIGPVDGQIVWRIFTLRDQRIVHIRDLVSRDDALANLVGWPVAFTATGQAPVRRG